MKGYFKMDISSIITTVKKDFTRDRKSVLKDFLNNNNDAVIISHINKSRGASIKFYYLKDGKMINTDLVQKNGNILIMALKKNGKKIYVYNKNNNDIKEL